MDQPIGEPPLAQVRGKGWSLVATHPVTSTLVVGMLVGVVSLGAAVFGIHVSGLASAVYVLPSALFYWRADEALPYVAYSIGPLLFWLLRARPYRARDGALVVLSVVGMLDLAFLAFMWASGAPALHGNAALWVLYSALNVVGLAGLVAALLLRRRVSFAGELAHRAALTAWLVSVGFVVDIT